MNNRKIFTFIVALFCSMCLHAALPTQFQYCYNCSRDPMYPKVINSTTIYNIGEPYVGYKGLETEYTKNYNNVSVGPWKLEYVENFDPENDKYKLNIIDPNWSRNQIRYILYEYYHIEKYWSESAFNDEIKAIARTIPVFELKQLNPATKEFERAAYGVVLAYANETNSVEHAALFVAAQYDWGCLLTDKEHSISSSFTIAFDENIETNLSSLVPETTDEEKGIEAAMEILTHKGTTDLVINRTLYKDGFFNTLCLPFSLTASELAESPLAGCELFSFVSATNNNGTLDINIAPETEITAGVPYLIRWESGEDLTSLTFNNIVVTTSTGLEVGTGDVTFVGTIGRSTLPKGNTSYLFVGENNVLYWSAANDDTSMKGFRAYFRINGGEQPVIPRNSPARLVIPAQLPTAIENASAKFGGYQKRMVNGQLIIIRNGVKYNIQGQKIEL